MSTLPVDSTENKMLPTFVRFADLKKRGIVDSIPQLRSLQAREGFPTGRRLSANVRAWTVDEIQDWLKTRDSSPAPLRGVALRARNAAKAKAEAAA
jgi:hypothetical protein